MKLIYVIAQGHTGSTLMDCILGTHPDFISSGELRYLNWQLFRTKNTTASLRAQDICTCEKDFRDCSFWSQVFKTLKEKTGKDIVKDPVSFDTAYFKQFAYSNSGDFNPSFLDRVKAYITREWCEQGFSYKTLPWPKTKIEKWLKNNWTLYETMAEVANKPFVVDSSKHLLIALLLQQYRPQDVTFLFIHRSLNGIAASSKRWATKEKKQYDLNQVIESKKTYEARVRKYKRKIPGLNFLDIDYEDFVQRPASFLKQVVQEVGANGDYPIQEDDNFFIDPSLLHIVAGNPMRYKGKQLVKYDERWKNELSLEELETIQKHH